MLAPMHIRSAVTAPTIRGEIMLAVIVLTVLPVLLTTIYFFPRINDLVEERVTRYSEAVVLQVENSIHDVVDQAKIISQQMTFWAVTQDLLLPGVEQPQNLLPAVIGTQQFISNLTLVFPFLHGVYVIGEDGRVFTGTDSAQASTLPDKEWVRRALTEGHGSWVVPPHTPDYGEQVLGDRRESVFSYVRGITVFSGGRHHGVIQVDLKLDYLQQLLEIADLGEQSGLYLVDERGDVAPSKEHHRETEFPLPDGIGINDLPIGALRTNGTVVIRRPLADTGWYLLGIISSSALEDSLGQVVRTSRIVMVVIACAAVAIALLVAGRITRPLATLVGAITRFGDGHLDERLPEFSNRDLGVVSRRFNTMAHRIKRLMDKVVEEEQQKDRAEIRALQAQINPHFLYNTLEVIRGIALAHGVTTAGEVAKSLAKIFRYSIDREKEAVTLGDELENVRSYVTILRHRYGERFEFVVDVRPDLLEVPTPRLFLQPLVENAFVHGVEPSRRHGLVRVEAIGQSDTVVLRIIDNGAGMPTKTVSALRSRMSNGSDEPGEPKYGPGIGIVNVDRRLKYAFGAQFGLGIDSELGEGTVVSLRIPVPEGSV